MENKFKVGDRIKCVRDQKVIYKGTVVLIYNNGNLGINENWRDHYFVCYPEEIELDIESQEPMKTEQCHSWCEKKVKTELDTQTKTLRDEFAKAALPALILSNTLKYLNGSTVLRPEQIIADTWWHADEMLKAREA